MFGWLPKEQLYVLVYLVTVSHSMMAGYMDKAQKYTEKALTQIEKLKAQDDKPILSVFKQPPQQLTMANVNLPTHHMQYLQSLPTNPTLHMPPQSALQQHQLTLQPIASTSTQHQQQLTQQSMSMIQQPLPPQPQVILNQTQQSVQYIHQPIGPQVQQQFGQYY
ncbi:MAU2 chromatid cohesion factor homolog [Eumeta japonica]|uniref:Cohesin loading complex subunit SCC4 homolog n=1 Tax=Eumeta variegata TaxID=151549 RepID=A0A4C1SXI3_EUMVA|nr:MAU2 chromatid cohesion factor homolog [Eumeta japonica]